MDIQALGHQWLKNKGYELEWGVGRHVLGSQIFDYWYVLLFLADVMRPGLIIPLQEGYFQLCLGALC